MAMWEYKSTKIFLRRATLQFGLTKSFDQESKKHFAMDKRSQQCDPNVDNIVGKFYEKDL